MTLEGWLTVGILIVMLGVMVSGRAGPDLAIMGALLMMLVLGIVEPAQAIGGFANPAVATIGLLYIVASGLKETGATSSVATRLIGRPRSAWQAQARLLAPVAGLSAFTNNTPLIAAMLPVLSSAARRAGIAASRLYMPLSFATILGGMCTLIGTSTNLVVFDLYEETRAGDPSMPAFGMFTLAKAALPAALIGLAYILIFGRRLLPAHEERLPGAGSPRQYMVAMRVEPGASIVGQSVERAGLRRLPGLFLSRIDRAEETITAVAPRELLEANDVLIFVGSLESVVDLQNTPGLAPVTDDSDEHLSDRSTMRLAEVVVSPASPLIGATIRDAAIRTRYGAVVIAAHRHGHRLTGRIGDIVIRPGDTLLLEAGPEFARRYRDSSEFTLVSELEGAAAPRFERAPIAVAILVGLVLVLTFRIVAPLTGAMAAAALMVLTRCCSGAQARASVDWPVLIVIGSAFGIGAGLEESGLAQVVADQLLVVAGGGSILAILILIYIMTLAFTMLVSNTAAAVLMFPIAIDAALAANIPILPVAVCVALAASADFSTPLGYQTNLMVMGPGGYRWTDFLRFGGPLTILVSIVTLTCISLFYVG